MGRNGEILSRSELDGVVCFDRDAQERQIGVRVSLSKRSELLTDVNDVVVLPKIVGERRSTFDASSPALNSVFAPEFK